MIRELLVIVSLVSGLATAQPCASPSFALPFDLGLQIEQPSRLQSADVDGDGREDLLAFLLSGRVFVFWNRAGGLVRGPSPDLGLDPDHVRFMGAADLNGDGRADLFVITGADDPSSLPRFESWLGDGTGGFARVASVSVDGGADVGLTLARVDGGAVPDILAVTPLASDLTKLQVLRWRNRGDGTFQPSTAILTLDNLFPYAGASVVAGDVNGDGRTDLVVSSVAILAGWAYASSVWLGDGEGGFMQSSPAPGGRTTRLLDVDGDGRDEVLYDRQGKLREAGILRREADGSWLSLARWTTDGGVLLGELDRDTRRMEALVLDDPFGAWRFDDSGPVRFATIPARSPAALLDLDGDGHLDVVALARDPVGSSSRLVLARNICGPGPGTTTLFLPAFLSLTGAEATRFETEVAVTNFGTSEVSAVLRLHPPDGAAHVDLASFALGPGRVRLLSTTEDAEAARLVLPEGVDRGTATLEVSTQDGSPPDVVADIRVLSERPDSGRGGVGLRAQSAERLQVGSTGDVAWLEEDAADRTNLAVASVGADPVTMRVSVFSSDPERPGRVTLPEVTLVPYGSTQWNRVLAASGLGARRGWARVERLAGGPWTAWATVNSNGTGDGSVVETAATGWDSFLPAIVGTDRYRTDVVLTNTAAWSRIASLRFPPVSGLFPLALDLEVEAESSRLVDPVAALRDAHLIPPGPYVGHATVGPALLAGARVTTDPSAPSGSFGVYTPAARFSWGETMLATGLRQDERNRSNLAIVVRELEPPSRFRVEMFDGRTGALVKTIEEVAPGTTTGAPSRIQLDSVLQGTGVPFGWARVVRTAGWSPFFAYAVVNDGAAPGLGSGDGTYLPGIPR